MKIYLVGSLRNPEIRAIAKLIRLDGHEVFDDWHAAGPDADEHWQSYEKDRGHGYKDALTGPFANHAFALDEFHLTACDAVVMVMPCGKSGHLELGWAIGRGKLGYILFPDGEPERWDLMHNFATAIHFDLPSLLKEIR